MSTVAEVEVVQSRGAAGSAETSIMSWVFEKFAGAVIGSAAGVGMDYVLAMIGIKESSGQTKARLENIQKGIDAILSEVRQIEQQINGLLASLLLARDEIRNAVQESVIDPAIGLIEAHYGTAAALLKGDSSSSQITSMGEGVRLRLNSSTADIDTKTFSEHVIGAWDIAGQIVKIARTAATTSFTTKPLLKGWTDYLIEKEKWHLAYKGLTVYLTLESYFQRLLAAQFQGINLVTSAKCYDKTEAEAKPITEAYLADVAPFLLAEADLFVKCADEIIVAMFTDVGTKWLYSPGSTKASDDVRTISRRANLIRAIVRAAVGKGTLANGGICGTVIGRNIEQEDAASRTFTPKGFAASAGDPTGQLAAGGNVPIEWGPSTDNKYATLREKSKSGFRAFHYYWPFTAPPEAGKPIDPSFDGGLTPQWYSLDTMEKLDSPKPEDKKVLLADFCEMRFLRGAIFADAAQADAALISTPADKGTTNNNENRVGFRNDEKHGIHAMRADETPTLQRLLAQGSLEGHMNYHLPQGEPVGFTLEFPLFRYKGGQESVHFVAELAMKLELVEDVFPNMGRGSASMLMSPRGKFWLTRKRVGSTDAATTIPLYTTDDRLSLWGQGSPAQLAETITFKSDVRLEYTNDAEYVYSLVLELCVINTLHGGLDPARGRHAKGRITYALNGVRMMWN
ncbi:MAG TPA: hypothetical protein VKB93_10220 [Thermoanaerobaculia bacterium]|nr:hypothetical protein [Thermoanaerobaculia bacterium]